MTDNEIIKALECCGSAKVGCRDCPLNVDEDIICQDELVTEVYKLINRQQTEDYKEEIKSEAVREFAEKLKQQAFDDLKYDPILTRYVVSVDDIDRLVEEMRCSK